MKRDEIEGLLLNSREAVDLERLVREAGEAVVYTDQDWTVRYCNDVYVANIGLPRHMIVGKTPFEYEPTFEQSVFYETIVRCRQDRRPTAKLGYSTILDRWLLVRVFPAASGTLLLANDASEQVVKQYKLAQQVVKDSLTGLPNKVGLLHHLQALKDSGEAFTLTVIGLDRFRSINDAMGYAVGDMALLEVASRLQTATLPTEQLYRLNGDEFVVMHSGVGDRARDRAAALVAAAVSPLVIHGHRFVLGATAGCVQQGVEPWNSELILKRAALTLRHAKKVARGSSVSYDPGLDRVSLLRADLETELRAAIDAEKLTLVLQPKGCLSRGSIVGAEALIRWPHPTRGVLLPTDFLPLAAEAGLMRAIDMLTLKLALKQLTELDAAGVSLPLSINLSAASLVDFEMVERVRVALRDSGVCPRLLEIEIPENDLMKDVDTSAKVLAAFSDIGVKTTIDDFGTGYSSFAYLARFPVHALKVDRSFVSGMTSSESNQKIVQGIVRLAHSLQMQVIAEGAEGPEELNLLRRFRCDAMQGYAFGKPMPLRTFVGFARRHAQPTETVSALTL